MRLERKEKKNGNKKNKIGRDKCFGFGVPFSSGLPPSLFLASWSPSLYP